MTLRRLVLGAAAGATLWACQGDNPGARDTGTSDTDAGDVTDTADAGLDSDVHFDGSDAPDGDAADVDATDAPDVPDALVERGFTSTPVAWVEAGTTYAYAVTVWPDDLTVELVNGPDGAALEDGVLRWEAPAEGVDRVTMDLGAFDGTIDVDVQTFDVKVDHAPVFLNLPSQLAYAGEEWRYAPTPEDPDGDAVTISLVEAPEWLAVEGSTLVGTPPEPGEVIYTVRGEAGPLSTSETFSLEVVERLRDLAFSPAWIPTSTGEVDFTGCCFDDRMRVFWGAESATNVSVPNAARLRASFGPLLPGQDRVSFASGEVVVGETALPLLVVPHAEPRFGDVDYLGVFAEDTLVTVRDAETGLVLESAASETLSGARIAPPESGGFMVAVEINEIASVPVPWGDVDPAVVTSVEPALHAPGTTIAVHFSGDAPPNVTAHWGDVSAACVVDSDPFVCRANVPAAALGPLAVAAGGVSIQRWVPAAIAASPVTPEWTTASRFDVPTVETLLYVTGIGFDDPAAELEAEGGEASLVEATETDAVIRLLPDADASDPMRVRVRIGGRTSAWWPFVDS